MRAVVTVAVLALCIAPAANAKFKVGLFLSNDEPTVRELLRATIHADVRAREDCRMRLLAVAPGADKSKALAAFINGGISIIGPSGPTFRRIRPTPRLGFLVPLARTGPKMWRATIHFPRVGRWRLVVPNWCAPGYASPLPVERAVTVVE